MLPKGLGFTESDGLRRRPLHSLRLQNAQHCLLVGHIFLFNRVKIKVLGTTFIKLKISISLVISQRYHVWVPHFNPRSKKHQVTSPVPFAQKTGPYEAAATANVEGSIGSSPRLRLRLLGMQGDFRLWRSSMIHSWSFGLSCRGLSKLSIWPIKPLYFWRESFGWNRVTNPDPYATQLLIQKLFFPAIPSEIFPSIHPGTSPRMSKSCLRFSFQALNRMPGVS